MSLPFSGFVLEQINFPCHSCPRSRFLLPLGLSHRFRFPLVFLVGASEVLPKLSRSWFPLEFFVPVASSVAWLPFLARDPFFHFHCPGVATRLLSEGLVPQSTSGLHPSVVIVSHAAPSLALPLPDRGSVYHLA
jgi:hypothetical protein